MRGKLVCVCLDGVLSCVVHSSHSFRGSVLHGLANLRCLRKNNNTRNVRITYHWGALVQPLLRRKSIKYYTFWVCVCSLSYRACNSHAPHCHLWPAPLYNIIPKYFINGMNKKQVIGHKMCVLIFSTTFVWNISHSKKNQARYYHKCTSVFMWSTRYYCQTWIKLEFFRQIFENSSNIKFNENASGGRRVVPCGQTNRRDETNSRFSQFYERA